MYRHLWHAVLRRLCGALEAGRARTCTAHKDAEAGRAGAGRRGAVMVSSCGGERGKGHSCAIWMHFPTPPHVFCNRCAVHTNLFRETIYHFMESRECFDSMIFSFLNIFSASSQCAGTVDKTSLSVDMFMMNTPVTKFLYITSRHRFSLHYTLKS